MKISIVLSALLLVTLCPLAGANQASDTTVTVSGQTAGATPFINKVTLSVSDLSVLERVQFAVTPKVGSVTRPLSATYTTSYLAGRGYVASQTSQVTVPVFGLYAGATNKVALTYFFTDGSSKSGGIVIATQPFDDPCPFNTPTILKPRTATTSLSYDFILVASSCSTNSPAVIDTDGAVRWVGTAGVQQHYNGFFANGVYLTQEAKLLRIELDGEVSVLADYATNGVTGFRHNIDPGKYGIILDINTPDYVGGSVHLEVDYAGRILKKWDLGEIIRNTMIAGGDDPSGFVVKTADWAHDNAVTYRKSDDSLIISSRENFVICLDYQTSAIRWILGDTNKLWYQYPSLKRFALSVAPGSVAPVGQHSVSITKDDHLLLFDNGTASDHHIPRGVTRNYSAARKYKLDLQARVATEVWRYPRDQSVKSAYRSSVYEDAAENYLVDYQMARNLDGTFRSEIFSLLPSGEKVFDYAYRTGPGIAAYRTLPIHWENLAFPAPTDVRLANLSARSLVTTGDSVGIAGFIISGPVPKKVVLRGRGPSLETNGQPLAGRLMNPRLELHNSSSQILQSNDDYRNGPNAAAISQLGLAPGSDSEAAILAQLPPGAYTAILRGANDTGGIGLAEVFDVDAASTSELGNLSARAFTSAGDNVLIGGLILRGANPKRILFRALGPELGAKGVANALHDPILDLYGANGMKIGSNDDWQQAANAAAIEGTGMAPADPQESAILLPVPAGNYTFIARGKNETEGVGLVEAFQLD